MPSIDCPAENATQHYLGPGYGHGVVSSDECVIVAVFESTERDGNRLKPTAFTTKQLNRDEFSLARLTYISKAEFDAHIVKPLMKKFGPLVGIVAAQVRTIREIDYSANGKIRPAVCVTDKVTKDDYDAHAAMGYAKNQVDLSDKQKMTIRATIHANLADAFGDLSSVDEVFPIGRATGI
jgi:hypothetical protein